MRAVTWETMTDKQIKNRIRAHLAQYMEDEGLDQVRMAQKMGVPQGTVSRALGGPRIGLSLMWRIYKATRISLDRLFKEDPPERFWLSGQFPGSKAKRM